MSENTKSIKINDVIAAALEQLMSAGPVSLTAYQVHNVINAINTIVNRSSVKPQEIYGYAKRYLKVESMSGVTFDAETLKSFLIAYYSGQIASSSRVNKDLASQIMSKLTK